MRDLKTIKKGRTFLYHKDITVLPLSGLEASAIKAEENRVEIGHRQVK